jgi:hypothetical protein
MGFFPSSTRAFNPEPSPRTLTRWSRFPIYNTILIYYVATLYGIFPLLTIISYPVFIFLLGTFFFFFLLLYAKRLVIRLCEGIIFYGVLSIWIHYVGRSKNIIRDFKTCINALL